MLLSLAGLPITKGRGVEGEGGAKTAKIKADKIR